MPRFRISIRSLMIVVLIVALDAGGIRVLMQEQEINNVTSAIKLFTSFGLLSLTAIVYSLLASLGRPGGLDEFLGILGRRRSRPAPEREQRTPPSDEPIRRDPVHYVPLGLVEGQRFRLPDRAECRVSGCDTDTPMAFLECLPPRVRVDGGLAIRESYRIDHDRAVWHVESHDWVNRCYTIRHPTGWTLDDLEENGWR